ncbi:cyanophycin synthetase, partial [Myxococcota bacterium]|nr:cyanophycin synthetase [Myxococcota bacterium]
IAVSLFEAVVQAREFDLQQVISELKVLREEEMLGPTTLSIVNEALSRGIPFIRLNTDNYVQLGHGAHQKRIQGSITGETSAIAVEIADEKTRMKENLRKSGIPVPRGDVATTEEEAVAIFRDIGAPVVVKPDVGNHGKGATINITDEGQLRVAFHAAVAMHERVIVEEYIQGFDFRLLVINGELVAAARREPAHVTGDGATTIRELIEHINADTRRGFGHEKVLTRIEIDVMTERLLAQQGLALESRPPKGEVVYLKATANLSQGGTATDVTSEIHPDIKRLAERTARIIGLDCVGVDALAHDVSLPVAKSGLKVIEVNAAPGFRMHLEPTNGSAHNVAKPLVDMLFPLGYTSVPVLAVTGTNGKTTTCKLITHTLKYSGKKVGLACTTGISIDGNDILSGDYSGPEGAGIILREPTVDHIVLEVARGGIVRRGVGVHEVDVGVLLNIGNDHIGTDWVETQEELCLVKSTVIEIVKHTGTSVLNADDPLTMSVRSHARGSVILFSLNPANPILIEHIEQGKTAVTVVNRNVIIRTSGLDIVLCTIEEIPITFGGIVEFNIANALAAIGALHALKLPVAQIRNGLLSFYPSVNQNPGRMKMFDFEKFKVLVDYGHNPDSARALAKLLPRLSKGRKISLCHGTGSRPDDQIIEYGRVLATVYDHVLIADFDPRHRRPGETQELVRKGLMIGGMASENIEIILDTNAALDILFSQARAGDLLVVQPDELEKILGQIIERYRNIHHEN